MGAVLALVACGNQNTDEAPLAGQPPAAMAPVAAAPPAAPPAPAAPAAAAATSPESAQCLELVDRGDFAEAVPICVRAAGIDPDNAAVQQALQTAQSKAANSAAAGPLGDQTP
jgi:hypothetical protein